MADLLNYVYMPLWLVVVLTLMAGIGFEFLVYRVIRLLKRATKHMEKPLAQVITLAEHRKEKSL
jgi:hypothetical protein